MIICGYQGVGKSTYCREHSSTTVDLDSSNYEKVEGWMKNYISNALTFGGKKVFISAHHEVINYLLDNKIEFELLVPALNKNAWRSRLEFRYHKNPILANMKAIMDFEDNFDRDMAFYSQVENMGVKVHRINAKIVTTIGDYI